MNKKHLLLNPDPTDGGGAGGGVFDDVAPGGGQGQGNTGDNTGGASGASGAVTPDPTGGGAAPQGLTAEAIADAIKKAGVGQTAPVIPQQQQFSQEDFDKAFNVMKVTPDQVKAFKEALAREDGDFSSAAELLQSLHHAAARQAATMAAYMVKDLEAKLMEQFNPIQSHFAAQQEEALRKEFFASNTDLEKYSSLVEALASKLRASGWKGTKEEAFKMVAQQARDILKTVPGAAAAQGNNNNGQTGQSSRMSSLSGGGQGGAGGSGTGRAKDPSHAVFD